jgi:hypothetical protein
LLASAPAWVPISLATVGAVKGTYDAFNGKPLSGAFDAVTSILSLGLGSGGGPGLFGSRSLAVAGGGSFASAGTASKTGALVGDLLGASVIGGGFSHGVSDIFQHFLAMSQGQAKGDPSPPFEDTNVVHEKGVDSDTKVGSKDGWAGKNDAPKWNLPSNSKAYGHSVNDHGAKPKNPNRDLDRARTAANNKESKEGSQGAFYNDNDIPQIEKITPPHPGTYVIDLGRSVGKVTTYNLNQPEGSRVTVKENVTQVFSRRFNDGSIHTSPVDDNYRP